MASGTSTKQKRRDRRDTKNDSGTPSDLSCMSPIEGCPRDFELVIMGGDLGKKFDERAKCWLVPDALYSNRNDFEQDRSKKKTTGLERISPKLPLESDCQRQMTREALVLSKLCSEFRLKSRLLFCPLPIICQCQLKIPNYDSRWRNLNVCEPLRKTLRKTMAGTSSQ